MKRYAVIGHPIGHTMSPFIHNRLFALCSIKADYSVFDIAPEKLPSEFRTSLKELDGFNITIPHKQSIIPLLDSLNGRAELYGSVNTVSTVEGVSTGFTTDPDGFVAALAAEQIPLSGRVVILGCGGVARVMAYEAVQRGADITFAIRAEDKAMCLALLEDIRKNFPSAKASSCGINSVCGDVDLLVNATPVGMFPNSGACPVDAKVISRSSAVFDAVYNPLKTVLIQKAAANGSRVCGGMSMLVYQAAASHLIWDGSNYEKPAIDEICAAASEELKSR